MTGTMQQVHPKDIAVKVRTYMLKCWSVSYLTCSQSSSQNLLESPSLADGKECYRSSNKDWDKQRATEFMPRPIAPRPVSSLAQCGAYLCEMSSESSCPTTPPESDLKARRAALINELLVSFLPSFCRIAVHRLSSQHKQSTNALICTHARYWPRRMISSWVTWPMHCRIFPVMIQN